MSSLKEIKNRITSVTSTKKITSAMKMVSSAKLHHAEGMLQKAQPYEQRLTGLLQHLLEATDEVSSSYAMTRPVKEVAIVAFSSNTGLCGTFNANVLKALDNRIGEWTRKGIGVKLYPVGKKVTESLRKGGWAAPESFSALDAQGDYAAASALASELMNRFAAEEIDRVELLYHHFKNAAVQELTCRQWLPFCFSGKSESGPAPADGRVNYLVEPSADRLLDALIPCTLRQQIYTAWLDTTTAEHAARVQAMQTASENANDLLEQLTLQYNKSRQQAITNELLDIMGGR